ncbi:MAG: LuxR C-terminal-related transcriptional regulator [Chloroflexota bacterium]
MHSDQASAGPPASRPGFGIRSYRPALPRDFVARPRFGDVSALAAPGVTLVVAPAGFGKTALLSDLAARSPAPAAWLSLAAGDDAPERFVDHLVRAVRAVPGIDPGFGESALALLRSEFDPALIAERLADDLLALPGPVLLVLDDFQHAATPPTASLLGHLVRWRPPTLRLLIASRTEPAIPLARARALGEVTDIGPDDLRFSLEETTAFLASQPLPGAGPAAIAGDLAGQVWELTGGWPIALRLHALALRDAAAGGALPADPGRPLREFLIDEVLAAQPAADREAMLRLALPETIDPALCARLCGLDDLAAAALLERLAVSDRLLTPLAGGAFSYHALTRRAFRDRLLARIGPAGVEDLHRQLGEVFAERGDVAAAASHFIEGGAEPAAVAIVERAMPEVLLRGEAEIAGQWLSLLPEPAVRRSPALLLARAAFQSLHGKEAASQESLRQAADALAGREDEARRRWFSAAMAALGAQNFQWLGDAAAGVRRMAEAIEGLGADRSVYHMMAVSMTAALLRLDGRTPEAIAALRDGELPPGSPPEAMTARLAMHRALMELHRGRPDLAIPAARASAQDAAALGIEGVWAGAEAWLGIGCLQRLDLDGAEVALPGAVANRSRVGMFHDRESTLALALLHHLRRRSGESVAIVLGFLAGSAGETDRRWQGDAMSFLARLSILNGNLPEARRWLALREETGASVPLHLMERPDLTAIHLGIAAGGAERDEAMDRLAALLPDLDRAADPLHAIRARLLLAVGRKSGRVAPLESAAPVVEAIGLGAPGGILLPFAEFQAPLGRLLREASRDGARIDAEIDAILRGESPHVAFAGDTLTPREYQVLLALRDGLSNKEIAARFHISLVTVKRHTVGLYRKLGVEGRVSAVRVAQERGLLER